MASKLILSAEVARETSFAMVGADGIPAITPIIADFYAAEISDKSQIVQSGDPILTDRNGIVRDALYAMPPEPGSVQSAGGDWYKRKNATFSLTMPVRSRGDGTNYDAWDKLPLWNLGSTALQENIIASPYPDDVATAVTATSHTGTDVTGICDDEVGHILRAISNGRADYACVTSVVGELLTYSPAFMSVPIMGDVIRPMASLYLPRKGVPATTTVAIKLNGIGWKSTCYGCKVTKITFNYVPETGRLEQTFEVFSPYVVYENTTNDCVPVLYADGGVAHHLLSYMKISDTGGTVMSPVASPAELAASSFCLDEFTMELAITHSPNGCGEGIVGMSDNEVVDVKVTGSMTLGSTSTDFDTDLWTGTMRSVMIGFNSANVTDEGEGAAIYIPSAVLTADPELRDTGKDHYRTKLTFEQGFWNGDTGSTDPADSPFQIAYGEAHTTP